MGGLVYILGILLLVLIAKKEPQVPVFSGFTKTLLIAIAILLALFIAFMAVKAPLVTPYMIGHFVGTILILMIFVGIGSLIHRQKVKKLQCSIFPQPTEHEEKK